MTVPYTDKEAVDIYEIDHISEGDTWKVTFPFQYTESATSWINNAIEGNWISVTNLFYNNQDYYFAVSSDGQIIKSSDGEHWEVVYTTAYTPTKIVALEDRLIVSLSYQSFVLVCEDPINAPETWIQSGSILNFSMKYNVLGYGNNTYVAISAVKNSDGCYIAAYSTDTVHWNTTTMPKLTNNAIWTSIAYGNGTFVVISNSHYVAYSTNGRTWNRVSVPSSRWWSKIIFATNKFVAIHSGSDTNKDSGSSHIMYSNYGTEWTEIDCFPRCPDPSYKGDKYIFRSIAYGNSKFSVYGALSTYSDKGFFCYANSNNALNWSSTKEFVYLIRKGGILDMCFNGTNFIACTKTDREYSTENQIIFLSSSDGQEYRNSHYQDVGLTVNSAQLAYGNNILVIVITGYKVYYSTDNGANITLTLTGDYQSVVFDGRQFLVVGGDGIIRKSTDGINWSTNQLPSSQELLLATVSNYAVILNKTGNESAYSIDGITWTSQTLPVSDTFYCAQTGAFGDIVFASGQNYFLEAYLSINEIIWNTISVHNYHPLEIIAGEIIEGTGIIVGITLDQQLVDGTYYESQIDFLILDNIDATNISAICCNFGNLVFLAMGDQKGLISEDGKVWQTFEVPAYSWKALTLNNDQTTFIAVGTDITSIYNIANSQYDSTTLSLFARKTTGELVELELNTDYSVTINQDDKYGFDATVTAISDITDIRKLVITRNIPISQEQEFDSQSIQDNTYENAVDKLTMIEQDREKPIYCMRVPDNEVNDIEESDTTLPPASKRIGTLLYFGDDGTATTELLGYNLLQQPESETMDPTFEISAENRANKILSFNEASELKLMPYYTGGRNIEVSDNNVISSPNISVYKGGANVDIERRQNIFIISELPASLNWKAMCYGMEKFVAIGENDEVAISAYSDDGKTWDTLGSFNSLGWTSIAYANGLFVAVANNDNSAYSTDGITWAEISMPGEHGAWYSVCYGNGKFVAVGQDESNATGIIAYCNDGVSWFTASIPVARVKLRSICYGNNAYVAVGNQGAVIYSQTGEVWSKVTAPTANYCVVCYGNGLFVALAESGSVIWSIDGIEWTQAELPFINEDVKWLSVCYGIGNFVATNNTNQAAFSTDGKNWSLFELPETAEWNYITCGLYDNTVFAALDSSQPSTTSMYGYIDNRYYISKTDFTLTQGDNITLLPLEEEHHFQINKDDMTLTAGDNIGITDDNRIFATFATLKAGDNVTIEDGVISKTDTTLKAGENISIDKNSLGLRFEQASFSERYDWQSVCYGNGRFVACNSNSIYEIYSEDGIEWTKVGKNRGGLKYLYYGNNKFLALNISSTWSILYSEDGINWGDNIPLPYNMSSVCYGNGKYVGMSWGMVGAYSEDGIEWNSVTILPNIFNLSSVCYGDNKFVVVAENYAIGAYSENGIEWHQMNMPLSADWYSVCYGNGKFVAVSRDGFAAYSQNGIEWYSASMPFTATWDSVCYGDEKFIAVSWDGLGACSYDGINWEPISMPSNDKWTSVCYGNGKFVAVAYGSAVVAYTASVRASEPIVINNLRPDLTPKGENITIQNREISKKDFKLTPGINIGISGNVISKDDIVLIPKPDGNVSIDGDQISKIDSTLTTEEDSNITISGNTISRGPDTVLTPGNNITISDDTINKTDTVLTPGDNITISSNIISRDPDTVLTAGNNITISGTTVNKTDTVLTPGNNITISGNTINKTNTVLTAGNNITISGDTINKTNTVLTQGNNIIISGPYIHRDSDTVLTPGDNITISSNIISRDPDTVLTAGNNITISGTTINKTNTVLTPGNNIIISSNTISRGPDTVLTPGDNITIGETLFYNQITAASTNLRSVCYGNGRWVAVGTGTAAAISYDEDVIEWLPLSLPNSITYQSICYGDGKFIAVASNAAIIAYSGDGGDSWEERRINVANSYDSITYGINKENVGVFVAIPASNSSYVAYSYDGETWNQGSFNRSLNWECVCCGNGRFVAVASNTMYGAYSDNGSSWTTMNIGTTSKTWHSVCYGNGKFVAVSGTNTAAYSEDGIDWTFTDLPTSQSWYSVAFGDGKFIALGGNNAVAAYSEDGITWTQKTLPATANWQEIAYGNGKFVGVSINTNAYSFYTSNKPSISLNAADIWNSKVNYCEKATIPYHQNISTSCYGAGRFVVLEYGYDFGSISTDGINWSDSITLPRNSSYWTHLCYGNDRFVALRQNDSAQAVYGQATSSIFTTTWSDTTLPISAIWEAMCYGNNMFVGVGFQSSSATIVIYTQDALQWSYIFIPEVSNWKSICYGTNQSGDNIYIAVGNENTGIFSVNDITSWNPIPIGTGSHNWRSICYGNNKFVVVGNDNQAAYSETIGSNIIFHLTNLPRSQSWTSVCYGDGKFVAVADRSDKAAYSYDGITWTEISLPVSEYWVSINYGNGKFVAVSNSGTAAILHIDDSNLKEFIAYALQQVG